ncbi:MAG: GNAT family N-acetyltransferase [Clostridia bacterium]|nr:GNAT family N-acetyltransferase [Clostridia bacterium]MBR4184882.1 GNAT family N-acetyltransferase [Clostridia bacterium]
MNHDEITRIFRDPPVLETTRLTLRKLLRQDSRDMYDYASRPEVTEYLLWQPHDSESYTRRYLNYLQSRYRAGDFHDWAVVLRENGRMIGTCGFTRFNFEANSAEIGYVLHPDVWGHGVAPEAARAVMRFGFRELRLHRIEARYLLGNERSRRVMEKLGMQPEGVAREAMYVKGKYVSVATWAILEEEYFGTTTG